MSDQQTYSGGCQCGAVRYHIIGSIDHSSFCHCRMCQKAFGNIGAAFLSVDREHFTWTRGSPREFRSSAPVIRYFCGDCGTPLGMCDDGERFIDIASGTLDDPSAVAPSRQIGVESKVRWFDSLAALPSRTTNQNSPPAAAGHYASRQHPDHDTDHWP